jgi:hypothetical protein
MDVVVERKISTYQEFNYSDTNKETVIYMKLVTEKYKFVL